MTSLAATSVSSSKAISFLFNKNLTYGPHKRVRLLNKEKEEERRKEKNLALEKLEIFVNFTNSEH